MRKNELGFTLIELLAVITIMGILMLVAIPAVSRTIENSRRDTFANLAKSYINTVTNAIIADELACGSVNVSATDVGTYYFKIDSTAQQTKDLMEKGGTSAWGGNDVKGYVTANMGYKNTYSIVLMDTKLHGINTETAEASITRTSVLVNGKTATITDATKIPQAPSDATKTECTLR